MNILISTVRVSGFRGLSNIEVALEQTTILTGMNNSGKTSFLKALQLALGNRQFLTQDDFYVKGDVLADKIIVDILIVPIDEDGKRSSDFPEDWEVLFTTERIKVDNDGKSFLPLRTIITFDVVRNSYKSTNSILQDWPEFYDDNGNNWYDVENGRNKSFHFDQVPFFYVDAQRDILEDTKLRSSYLGRMLSKIEYSPEDISEIENQIKSLNKKAVNGSEILTGIKTSLKELDSAMDTDGEGIEITPFTKKIRDLNKGLTIYYNDSRESFSMAYHGMGTRSWSSLLTLKAFISLLDKNSKREDEVFFPILAIEEPEGHLHPNAQKKLYMQLNSIPGQKIISTHSPYIAAAAELHQIRNFYKDEVVTCGAIDISELTHEDIRKISRQVVNTRGEMFFSRMLVFFEGETEEQALPIFAKKHFSKTPFEMGVNFVGVGGQGSYLPFLRFAESLQIPWVIFSDAEPDAIACVKKHYNNSKTTKTEDKVIVFLDTGNSFEKQLIADCYSGEIRKAIASFDSYENETHRMAKEESRLKEIKEYSDNELLEILTHEKTKYGPRVAEQILEGGKDLPTKVVDLFNIISNVLKWQETI